jgi:5-methylcytosine-specific restriction endonuclease McrA
MLDIEICGTPSGYAKHRRNKQEACEPCKNANAERSRLNSYKYKNSLKETRKNWYLNNKEKAAMTDRKRRALKNQTKTETYTTQQVINLYGSLCNICGIGIDLQTSGAIGKKGWQNGLHIDHVIPLSKGGHDTLNNVRPTHALCNVKKGSKVL